MIETFPLPEPDERLDGLDEVLSAQQELRADLVTALADRLDTLEQTRDKAAKSVKNGLMRSLNGRIGRQQALVDDIIAGLADRVDSRLAQQQFERNLVDGAILHGALQRPAPATTAPDGGRRAPTPVDTGGRAPLFGPGVQPPLSGQDTSLLDPACPVMTWPGGTGQTGAFSLANIGTYGHLKCWFCVARRAEGYRDPVARLYGDWDAMQYDIIGTPYGRGPFTYAQAQAACGGGVVPPPTPEPIETPPPIITPPCQPCEPGPKPEPKPSPKPGPPDCKSPPAGVCKLCPEGYQEADIPGIEQIRYIFCGNRPDSGRWTMSLEALHEAGLDCADGVLVWMAGGEPTHAPPITCSVMPPPPFVGGLGMAIMERPDDAAYTLTTSIRVCEPCGPPKDGACPEECPTPWGHIPQPGAIERCQLPAVLRNGLPVPGSPEWCRLAPEITAALVELGSTFANFFSDLVGIQNETVGVHNELMDEHLAKGGWAGKIVAGVLKMIHAVLRPVTQRLGHLLDCWKQLSEVSVGCDPKKILALSILKTLFALMRRFTVGLSWPIHLHIEVELSLEPMERAVEYLVNEACPTRIPEPHHAIESLAQSTITTDTYRCWMRSHGHDPDVWEPVRVARSEKIHHREHIQYLRRLHWTDPEIKRQLQSTGWVNEYWADAAMEMYWELPGIADHLHWLRRNVFDTHFVQQYDLLLGFDDKFWPHFGEDLTILGMRKEYAKLHYAAHWIMPSPEQMKEFVYRLRADTTTLHPGRTGAVNLTDADDFQRILTEQAYGVWARKRFAETLHKVPAPTYTRELFDMHLISDATLESYHQDQGYNKEDAHLLAEANRLTRDRHRQSLVGAYNPRTIIKLARLGILDQDEAERRLAKQGWRPEEIFNALKSEHERYLASVNDGAAQMARRETVKSIRTALGAGTLSDADATQALVAAGWQPAAATATVAAHRAGRLTARAERLAKLLARAFKEGVTSEQQIVQMLSLSGYTSDAIAEMVAEWKVVRALDAPEATKEQIISYYVKGLLSLENARARLVRLGWGNPDLALSLADARMRRDERLARERKAMQREERARARALEQEAARAERDRRRIQRALMQAEPLSLLKRRYCRGDVSREWVQRRLGAAGYAADDIAAWLGDWEASRKCAPQGPPPGEGGP